jgi:hypothetical protein
MPAASPTEQEPSECRTGLQQLHGYPPADIGLRLDAVAVPGERLVPRPESLSGQVDDAVVRSSPLRIFLPRRPPGARYNAHEPTTHMNDVARTGFEDVK